MEGRQITLFSDHKPSTHSLFRVSPPWLARQQRQLSFISEFTSSIQHVPGPENVVADALSHPVGVPVVAAPGSCPKVSVSLVPSVNSGTHAQGLVPTVHSSNVSLTSAQLIDYSNLAQLQKQCSETQDLISSSVLRVQLVWFSGVLVLCYLSTGVPRPLVPVSLQKTLVPPTSWSVSPWSLSFSQVNLSTFCLEKFIQRCLPIGLFLHSMSEKQDPNPHLFQCSTDICSQ